MDCWNCKDMPKGYYCLVCKREGTETTDFEFQWYAVTVRITATTPVITWRHGPRKGEKKDGGWSTCLYDSPTHYYNYNVQGIRNEAACKVIVSSAYENLAQAFRDAGYTDVEIHVTAVGVRF